MIMKLSMYVGLHDVYPAMDVNLAFCKEVKMTAACNFISLGEKMRELLNKNGERKEKREEKKRGKLLITRFYFFIYLFLIYSFTPSYR